MSTDLTHRLTHEAENVLQRMISACRVTEATVQLQPGAREKLRELERACEATLEATRDWHAERAAEMSALIPAARENDARRRAGAMVDDLEPLAEGEGVAYVLGPDVADGER
jgi:hypothetical protein